MGVLPSKTRRQGPAVTAERLSGLCLECGFCCNGVLFADVKLRRGDSPRQLARLGVPLAKRGRDFKLPQPCACLDGHRCRIYPARPERCRTFDCRLLLRLRAGELTVAAARGVIRRARREAEAVRRCLRQMGEDREHLPLSRRYRAALRQPINLAAHDGSSGRHGRLLRAVARLTALLKRHYL